MLFALKMCVGMEPVETSSIVVVHLWANVSISVSQVTNMTVLSTAVVVKLAQDSDALTGKFWMKKRACANVKLSGSVKKDIGGTLKLVTAKVKTLFVI